MRVVGCMETLGFHTVESELGWSLKRGPRFMVASRMEEVKISNPWDRGRVVWGYSGSRPFDAPETSALDLFIRTLSRASRLARSLSSSSSSLGNDESFAPTLPPRTSPYVDPTAFLELRSYG
jgi:Ser/Thr protein kinase RdoA (MazF antagonist)